MAEQTDYQRISDAYLKKNMDLMGRAFAAQVDYGKWLISSLFLMHGSAIGGLIFKSAIGAAPPPYLIAVFWFVGGIVAALGSGFAAWCNFTYASQQYDIWADPNVLADAKYWGSSATVAGMNESRIICLALGALSVAFLVCGSIHVLCVWR